MCSGGLQNDDCGINTIKNYHDIIPHTKIREDNTEVIAD